MSAQPRRFVDVPVPGCGASGRSWVKGIHQNPSAGQNAREEVAAGFWAMPIRHPVRVRGIFPTGRCARGVETQPPLLPGRLAMLRKWNSRTKVITRIPQKLEKANAAAAVPLPKLTRTCRHEHVRKFLRRRPRLTPPPALGDGLAEASGRPGSFHSALASRRGRVIGWRLPPNQHGWFPRGISANSRRLPTVPRECIKKRVACRRDSKVSVTRNGGYVDSKVLLPGFVWFIPPNWNRRKHGRPTHRASLVPFLGGFFVVVSPHGCQALPRQRIASMALSSRSTCAANANGLSRALSAFNSSFFAGVTCALAWTRAYGVCGSP